MEHFILPAEQALALGKVLSEETIDYDVEIVFGPGDIVVRPNPGGPWIVSPNGKRVRVIE